MTTRKTCVICSRPITERFYVCLACTRKHSIPYKYKDWPRWLKDLVNMEIKNLSILRMEEQHISIAVPADEIGGQINDSSSSCHEPINEKRIIKTF